ncbi:MAG: Lipoprotein-releasing system permease protein [Bacteroidetes bacterium]|nr:Lipoprotein-releasing system permease protein [Bacteroidota bacterium]
MSYSTFIARRYLHSGRNQGFFSFITAISILGVILGTATLIIALSVLGGFEKEITEKVVGFTSHVQILGFQNQPLKKSNQNAELIRRSIPVVSAVSPFVAREALIRFREEVDGILLKGIDRDNDVSTTRRYIVAGTYELGRERGAMPKIVVGKKLAAKLALHVGDKVTVFGIGRYAERGLARVMQFIVSGIYESGMAEYDDIYAFTDLSDAQTLFQIPDAVTGYDLMLASVDSAESVSGQVQDLLGYPHYGRTVFQTYRNLFSWIELQKKPIPIILGLIIIVATVNIIGTLLMMVLDKTREIGVLAAMGATRWGITKIFLRQGFTIALTGTLIGNGLAFGLCWAQQEFKFFSLPSDIYFMTSVPILLRPEYFLLVSAITLLLCLLSSWVPARLASGMRPVNAIRFA